MGQSESTEASPDKLSRELAVIFAKKCFTQLELYCFKEVFASLADSESDIQYWDEGTLCRYLELPDALDAGPVIYHMATSLGAFPFPSQAPSILTFDALIKVVTIMTERYAHYLRKGNQDRVRLFYSSLAVFDRRLSQGHSLEPPKLENPSKDPATKKTEPSVEEITKSTSEFAIDEPRDDDEEEDSGDELALEALEALNATDAIGLVERLNINHAVIPSDNLLRLIQLLLLIAPLQPQESLSKHAERLSETQLRGLRSTAKSILHSFAAEDLPGISYHRFKSVEATLPYMFDGFNPLFEHFLFEKDFDLSKRKSSVSIASTSPPAHRKSISVSSIPPVHRKSSSFSAKSPPLKPQRQVALPQQPLIPREGDILDLNILSQLSFFIKGSLLFRHLHPLYFGSQAGFSMGSFEKAVFNWKAPSLLLISGTILPDVPSNSRERAFSDSLPAKRFPSSARSNFADSHHVIYGAFIPTQWRHSHKQPFGTVDTLLFQLHPTHDVFRASSLSTNYTTFVIPPSGSTAPGINFGSPLRDTFFAPTAGSAPSYAKTGVLRRASNSFSAPTSPISAHGPTVPLGPVSLYIDDGLEYAVFTHAAGGGGSFRTSGLPGRKGTDWQDRFEIEALEVWGCGGDEEAEAQRKAQEWEEREAQLRKDVNIGRGGDLEADRELLRMAGLVGHDQGGSMG